MDNYVRRIVDDQLDDWMAGLAAISIEGPRGVGKTVTATRRARSVVDLDRPGRGDLISFEPSDFDRGPYPVLFDEWQRYPPVWDAVRRSVDRDATPGRFLLTGSADPVGAPIHSGAGRIVTLRMRPMSLVERGLDAPVVSLSEMLAGPPPHIRAEANATLSTYAAEILRSGFPGIRELPGNVRKVQLDGYLDRVVRKEFAELGQVVRRPATLRAWLAAYAAATSTTASYTALLDASTAGLADKPSKPTALTYRDVLQQLWLLEPVPGWLPQRSGFTRLGQAPKHQLADPALAARLLNVGEHALLTGAEAPGEELRDGPLLGSLFESLVTQSVRVYAQVADAQVHHLRTRNGDHEVDLIVEGEDRRVVAFEVKLTEAGSAGKHLHWLKERLGDDLADAAIITTGRHAYRRRDGIAVIPASLLGP